MEDAHMDESFYRKMNVFFSPNVTSSWTPHSLQSHFTIRDHFAASFIQGFGGNPECCPTQLYHFENIAEDAYKMADAMMKERAK